MSDEELIVRYLAFVSRQHAGVQPLVSETHDFSDDPLFWAWDEVNDIVGSDPDRGWHIVLAAINRCGVGQEYVIGAGPLERLLISWPRQLTPRVIAELHSNTRFRDAFAVVRFSLEYASPEDAAVLTAQVREANVPGVRIPEWLPSCDDEEEDGA